MPTRIEWTDRTWNPTRGCRRVSPGCEHCYAERVAARFSGPGQPYERLVKVVTSKSMEHAPGATFEEVVHREYRWNGTARFVPEKLDEPLRWRKPSLVFVDSMSDLFHDDITNEQIAAVFGVMAAARHTFQILTKRERRARKWFEWVQQEQECPLSTCGREMVCYLGPRHASDPAAHATVGRHWPLPNVWLGVSVEDQQRADERIPTLLEIPSAVRFLSCEPLLGHLDVSEYLDPCAAPCGETSATIDWVITGCESGRGARPAEVDWYRSLRDQCAGASVPFFLKQAMHTPSDFVAADSLGRKTVATLAIGSDVGSKQKAGGVIGLPYLDGVQHAAFPTRQGDRNP